MKVICILLLCLIPLVVAVLALVDHYWNKIVGS